MNMYVLTLEGKTSFVFWDLETAAKWASTDSLLCPFGKRTLKKLTVAGLIREYHANG